MQTRSSAGYQGVLKGMSLFLLLALVVTACGTPNPGPPPQQKQTLTSRLETFFTSEVEAKVFSGCVLIARADKVLFSKGYSMANWTQHVPNTPQTRFRLASVTKTFTAMAMLILQERGKLHVQDHICLYISSCPPTWQPITIQQLLTHTSGIPDYAQFEDFDTAKNVPVSPRLVIWHQGVIYGFRAFLVHYADEQVSIIVLSNLEETLNSGFFPGVEKIVFATTS